MWKCVRWILQVVFFSLGSFIAESQTCDHILLGYVKDLYTDKPIAYAHVYVKESKVGTISDDQGQFTIEGLCKGAFHISISHIGCETIEVFLELRADTSIQVLLDHTGHLLDEVSITGKVGEVTTQKAQTLSDKHIAESADKNLGDMLANLSGVSTIGNGIGISKPVVHGLYGNRLTILNNGIAQSGQQWGVDHSPEIDPLVANLISVVKGVGVVEYPGSNLGSVILVRPGPIEREPHLHGKTRYYFESNGLGHGLNVELQQYGKSLAWRLVGTGKKSGDHHTPDYFLRNTGTEEAHIALQLEKELTKKWKSDLYFSSFNAEIGILRGAHIGNLTDLEKALTRNEPFFTQDNFSYALDAPRQQVNHHLLKVHQAYTFDEKQWIDVTYALQYNLRKEFDVRRSGRSNIPALSLKQISHFLEGKYQRKFKNEATWKSGIQLNRNNNSNVPETGILPLIPNYISSEVGLFVSLHKDLDRLSWEIGSRYSYEERNVATISSTIPREIIRYRNEYSNLVTTGGVQYRCFDWLNVGYNLGYASRSPEVNELYSNGLHQGVSGIEEGDPNLDIETSLKTTLSLEGKVRERLIFESFLYYQNIDNYIFLDPQDDIRLTIRGAFPVFKYTQTAARIFGVDLSATYQISEPMHATIRYSYLKGQDKDNDLPLVFMPSNNIYSEVNYHVAKIGPFQNIEFQLNNLFVFEQTYLLPSQDFAPPPAAYNLLGCKVSVEKQLSKLRLDIFLKAENLLNISYRDYLNRQRYFADELGINLVAGISVSF